MIQLKNVKPEALKKSRAIVVTVTEAYEGKELGNPSYFKRKKTIVDPKDEEKSIKVDEIVPRDYTLKFYLKKGKELFLKHDFRNGYLLYLLVKRTQVYEIKIPASITDYEPGKKLKKFGSHGDKLPLFDGVLK